MSWMSEPEQPRRGKCPVCKEDGKWLHFALGSYKGDLWCNWICNDCYKSLRKEDGCVRADKVRN